MREEPQAAHSKRQACVNTPRDEADGNYQENRREVRRRPFMPAGLNVCVFRCIPLGPKETTKGPHSPGLAPLGEGGGALFATVRQRVPM